MKKLTRIATTAAFLLLAACIIPEEFEVSVTVNRDGSYLATYGGTVVDGYAAMWVQEEGGLPEEGKAWLEKVASELKREPGFKSVVHRGEGRFEVLFELEGKRGEEFYFPYQGGEFFSVKFPDDDTLRVSSIKLSESDLDQLKETGIKVDGELRVEVARGVEVIEHNASSEPFLGFGSFTWKIGSPDVRPFIHLRLGSS